jgi:hypothetical protein
VTAVQLQLPLFASSTPRSSAAAPSSLCSSVPPTCSSEQPRAATTNAIDTTPKVPAQVSAMHAGVGSAGSRPQSAKSTVASAARPTLPIAIERKHTADSMLSVPRPTTRADCGQEARPCPWTGCRHHLLLEVAGSRGGKDMRPTSLRLNRPNRGRTTLGRRPGLTASAAAHVVQTWIDDAAEQLGSMMHTCSLDVVDDYPDGLAERSVAFLLGVTEKAIRAELESALLGWRAAMPCDDCGVLAGQPCRTVDGRPIEGLHVRRGRAEIDAMLRGPASH